MSNYKIYAPLVSVVGMLMFLLNFCTKITACAFVFTLLMLTINVIYKTFGFKRAFQTIATYVGLNIMFLSSYDYIVGGQVFVYLVPVSLLAVLLASIALMQTMLLLENRIGTIKSSFVALISAALVDGIVMSVYFINYLSAYEIASIFTKEVFFKFIYAIIVLAIIKSVSVFHGKYELQSLKFKLRN